MNKHQNKEFVLNEDFTGVDTYRDPSDIADSKASSIQNMVFDGGKSFRPIGGLTTFSTGITTASTPGKSAYTWKRSSTKELPIISYGTQMDYYDAETASWYPLLTGLTTGKRFGFAEHVLSSNNSPLLFFCNGYDSLTSWNGAISHLTSGITAVSTSVPLDDANEMLDFYPDWKVLNDTSFTTNWQVDGATDALAPSISNTEYKVLPSSVKLSVDASASGTDVGTWTYTPTTAINAQAESGAASGSPTEGYLCFWLKLSTVDYLVAAGTALRIRIGSGSGDYVEFTKTKANLATGWNALNLDLTAGAVTGTPVWTAIDYFQIHVISVAANSNDYDLYINNVVLSTSTGTYQVIVGSDVIDYKAKGVDGLLEATGIDSNASTGASVAQVPDYGQYTSSLKTVARGNILASYLNRVFIAGFIGSTSTVIYSKQGDATNFTSGTNPTDAGIEDFPGTFITAMSPRRDNLVIYSEDKIRFLDIGLNDAADTKIVSVKEYVSSPNVGAASSLGVINALDSTFHVSPNGDIKSLEYIQNNDVLQLIQNTNDARNILKLGTYTSSSATYFDNKIIFSGIRTDATYNDFCVFVDAENRGIGFIRGWNVGAFFQYSGDLYFISSIDNTVFKAFSGYNNNGNPINAAWTSKRMNNGVPANQKSFNLGFVEGLISAGAEIGIALQYNEGGSLGVLSGIISGTGSYVSQSSANTFGSIEFGEEPFGSTREDVSGLNYFRVYLTMPLSYRPNNYSFSFLNTGVDSRWVILRYGVSPALEKNIDASKKLALTQS